MQSKITSESDRLVAFSRRGLWVALALLVALGAYAVIINFDPNGDAAAMAQRMVVLLPVAIVVAVAAVGSSLKGARSDPNSPAMKAVLNDELRRRSLHLAYRNGLFAVLLAQPLLALVLVYVGAAHPVPLMASGTALCGVAAVLCSLLYLDR